MIRRSVMIGYNGMIVNGGIYMNNNLLFSNAGMISMMFIPGEYLIMPVIYENINNNNILQSNNQSNNSVVLNNYNNNTNIAINNNSNYNYNYNLNNNNNNNNNNNINEFEHNQLVFNNTFYFL